LHSARASEQGAGGAVNGPADALGESLDLWRTKHAKLDVRNGLLARRVVRLEQLLLAAWQRRAGGHGNRR